MPNRTTPTTSGPRPETGPSATSRARTSGYADVNGLHLYFERYGDAGADPPPIVRIHGGLMTIDLSWAKLIPILAADREVVALELQGHGRTSDTEREFTPAHNAADVVALLDHLGIGRAIVIGHSTGAATALELAVHHGDRIAACVSLSGSVKPDAAIPEFADMEALMATPRVPTAQEIAAMREAYERLSATPERFEEFQAKIAGADDGSGWSDEELAGISCPVLEVLGDLDFTTFAHLDVMQRLIPSCRIGVLPGTPHTQVPTRVDLLAPMLTAFLDEVAPPRD